MFGAEVYAYDYYIGSWGGSALTDENGNYVITGLTPGDYRVQAIGDETCAGEYYNNAYDWNGAISVTVVSRTDIDGTDFSLKVSVQRHGNDLERFIKHPSLLQKSEKGHFCHSELVEELRQIKQLEHPSTGSG
jgi:hypothetical protein